jgi:D-3-phosphoglycerate dehydrogenase / 2-oxoglutarate reductase
MATNKKKILVTESMSQQGRALLHARDDIELVEFPNMISARDFEAMLKEQAPVHGVASAQPGSASRSSRPPGI